MMLPGRTFKNLLLLAALVAAPAFGDMYVDRSIVIFEPSEAPRQDVKVSNTSAENIYVQVEVLAVTNPGEDNETRERVTDPSQLKLIATPNKLVVPPNGQKLIRIVNLQPAADQERIYRINVTPVVAPLADETSQLRIVVAYQVLTIVQPAEPQSELKVTRNGRIISFTNTGNTNVLLSDGSQCDPANPEACEELTSKRLYAGNTWSLELPYDAPVGYSIRSFDGIKKEIFP